MLTCFQVQTCKTYQHFCESSRDGIADAVTVVPAQMLSASCAGLLVERWH